MRPVIQKALGLSAIALLAAGLITATAESASASTITLAYPTQAACQAGEAYYVSLHYRVTSGCTWYFVDRTDPDPWMFTASN
jgi:predicted RNA-binding Zn ribbon-like protein